MQLSAGEVRRIATVARALDWVPASGLAAGVFEAIRPCVPLAAGLFCIIRPGALDALVSHAVGLPPEVFESWLGTPPEQLAPIVAPVVASVAGSLSRDSDAITSAQREQIEVFHALDAAGLGEGAGYKVAERVSASRGSAHFMLALIMERGDPVPPRSQALLAALNPSIRAAVLRLGLPLVARESILLQIVEEQAVGYICVARSGEVLEANRRAHHLVTRYQGAARIEGRRGAMAAFAWLARMRARGGQAWHLTAREPAAELVVHAHRLSKEAHALPEDVVLLMLTESLVAPLTAGDPRAFEQLSPRQREIAVLLASTGASHKELAGRLGLSVATVRTHAENVYRALHIHSRAELVALYNCPED